MVGTTEVQVQSLSLIQFQNWLALNFGATTMRPLDMSVETIINS